VDFILETTFNQPEFLPLSGEGQMIILNNLPHKSAVIISDVCFAVAF